MALDTDEEMDAYREGKQAFIENKRRFVPNPYPKGSKEYDAFLRGMNQSLKASDNPTSYSPGAGRRSSSLADKYRNMRDWTKRDDDD